MAPQVKYKITAVDNTTAATNKAGKNFNTLGSTVKKAFIGIGVLAAGKAILDSFQKQEQATQKLNAIIKATGGAAGFTTQQMADYAAQLQKITTFDDDVIMGGQAILATFKSIQGTNFNRATKSVLDLSAAFNQDLKSSAIQLGKALEDPTRGMTALRRVGVSFTKSQEEMIKSLQEAGDVAAAQGIILEVLEGQVGGVAEEMAKGASGQIQQFQNQLGDVLEIIGQAIIPVISDLLGVIGGLFDWFGSLSEGTQKFIVIAGGLVLILPKIIGMIKALKLAMAGSPFGLLIAAAPIVIGLVGAIGKELTKTRKRFTEEEKALMAYQQRMKDAAEETAKALKKSRQALFSDVGIGETITTAKTIKRVKNRIKELSKEIENIQKPMTDYTNVVGLVSQTNGTNEGTLKALREELRNYELDLHRLTEKQQQENEIKKRGIAITEDQFSIVKRMGELRKDLANSETLGSAFETDKLDQMIEKQNLYKDAIVDFVENGVKPNNQALREMLTIYNELGIGIQELEEKQKTSIDEIKASMEELASTAIQTGFDMVEALGGAIAQSLAGTKDAWKAFARVGIDAIATIIDGLAKVEFAKGVAAASNPITAAAAPGHFLAAGAITAIAGAVRALPEILSFAEGTNGSFVTNGPQMMLVGDNPSGKERVTVEPLEKQGMNDFQVQQPLRIHLDSKVIYDGMLQASRRGILLIDKKAVV